MLRSRFLHFFLRWSLLLCGFTVAQGAPYTVRVNVTNGVYQQTDAVVECIFTFPNMERFVCFHLHIDLHGETRDIDMNLMKEESSTKFEYGYNVSQVPSKYKMTPIAGSDQESFTMRLTISNPTCDDNRDLYKCKITRGPATEAQKETTLRLRIPANPSLTWIQPGKATKVILEGYTIKLLCTSELVKSVGNVVWKIYRASGTTVIDSTDQKLSFMHMTYGGDLPCTQTEARDLRISNIQKQRDDGMRVACFVQEKGFKLPEDCWRGDDHCRVTDALSVQTSAESPPSLVRVIKGKQLEYHCTPGVCQPERKFVWKVYRQSGTEEIRYDDDRVIPVRSERQRSCVKTSVLLVGGSKETHRVACFLEGDGYSLPEECEEGDNHCSALRDPFLYLKASSNTAPQLVPSRAIPFFAVWSRVVLEMAKRTYAL